MQPGAHSVTVSNAGNAGSWDLCVGVMMVDVLGVIFVGVFLTRIVCVSVVLFLLLFCEDVFVLDTGVLVVVVADFAGLGVVFDLEADVGGLDDVLDADDGDFDSVP